MIDLNVLEAEFESKLEDADSEKKVLELKRYYLGKSGKLSLLLKSLKDATEEERRTVGPKANKLKQHINELCSKKLSAVEVAEINNRLARNTIDLELREERTVRGSPRGGYHPRTLIGEEVEDIFLSMGFEILDGPHIEDEYHNFEALNIPSDHPARDMQDTFWFEPPSGSAHLLRTHTSTIQIRGMVGRTPPFRFIAPGLVFRSERTDASHEMVFAQLEGMMVGENISVANLIYFMRTLLTEIFEKEVEVRLRPGYFPFVEPGFELEIKCAICKGSGCSVCKYSGWVELLPCGMVHPNVLLQGGIDPEKYSGFAFGLGLDRLVMMRYGIDDIRHLSCGDLRFNSQFAAY